MNNAGLNREQLNDTIKRRTFYSVIEGLFPSKKINYPTSRQENYQGPKKIQYPIAKKLFNIKE